MCEVILEEKWRNQYVTIKCIHQTNGAGRESNDLVDRLVHGEMASMASTGRDCSEMWKCGFDTTDARVSACASCRCTRLVSQHVRIEQGP